MTVMSSRGCLSMKLRTETGIYLMTNLSRTRILASLMVPLCWRTAKSLSLVTAMARLSLPRVVLGWQVRGGGSSGGEGSVAEDGEDSGSAERAGDRPAKKPKEGTAAWYRFMRDEPILDGFYCEWSLLQVCFWLARMKSQFGISDVVIDVFCSFIHFILLPPGNIFPPSYYIIRAVLGVPSDSACTSHLCDRCWTVFPHLDPSLWFHHRHDTCGCVRRRFKIGVGGRISPNRCVFYFDEEETITELITKPGVLEDIIDTRDESWDQPWTF